jgi:methyl coenzyme M reductase gamma subunit
MAMRIPSPQDVVGQLRSPTGVRGDEVIRAPWHLEEAAMMIDALHQVVYAAQRERLALPTSVQEALHRCERQIDLTFPPSTL